MGDEQWSKEGGSKDRHAFHAKRRTGMSGSGHHRNFSVGDAVPCIGEQAGQAKKSHSRDHRSMGEQRKRQSAQAHTKTDGSHYGASIGMPVAIMSEPDSKPAPDQLHDNERAGNNHQTDLLLIAQENPRKGKHGDLRYRQKAARNSNPPDQ